MPLNGFQFNQLWRVSAFDGGPAGFELAFIVAAAAAARDDDDEPLR